ncbi:sensor histidine kinase [Hymenobacter nivis]|uniref:Sensor histidine kinase n=1 Tax=Hymenobacter nivis TaxID=1850093 RepID=A0A2Z3GKK0_9BACT|nr:histidine kinase [Hymenobacter nivis]AWM31445.1 sensor histidine kinase [Hymenobacter nivis]
MADFSPRRALQPLIHVLVWGLFGLTFLLFHPLTGRVVMPPQFWVKQGLMLAVWVGAFYLTVGVSVPRLLFRGHTGWFVGALVATAALLLLANYGLEKQLHLRELMDRAFHAATQPAGAGPQLLRARGSLRGPRGAFRFDATSTLITLLVLGIATSITVVQRWQNEAQGRERLEQQRVLSELASLKAQINPHFFFNTLNNIYALTLLDGEQARAAIHRLSRMMRYVLYDTAAGPTLLSQEVAFIQDYITLMQLRLTDRVTVEFAPPAPLRDVPLAPMLLLPFVENAFKHGAAASHTSRIVVALRQPTPHTLALEVRNTLLPTPTTDLAGSNGIGLANTRRRLELLYPGRYDLRVTERTPTNEYLVELALTVE